MGALGLVFHGECVPRDGSLHVGAPQVLAWHPLPWIGQENPLQILCPPVPWFLSLSIRTGQVFLPGSCRGSSGQLGAVGHSQDRAPSPPSLHPSIPVPTALHPAFCSLPFPAWHQSLQCHPLAGPAEVTGAASSCTPQENPNPPKSHPGRAQGPTAGTEGQAGAQPQGQTAGTKIILLSLSLTLALLETLCLEIHSGWKREWDHPVLGCGGAQQQCPASPALTWDL